MQTDSDKSKVANFVKGFGNDYFKNKDYANAAVKYKKVKQDCKCIAMQEQLQLITITR